MIDLKEKDYVAVVQCHIVKQRCSGYYCEKAFNERTEGFADYPKDKALRSIYIDCGGCCGRALHRKLANLVRKLKRCEAIDRDRLIVQFSTCITRDNFHAPPCPHLDYLKALVGKLKLDFIEDTHISDKAEERRQEGVYRKKT